MEKEGILLSCHAARGPEVQIVAITCVRAGHIPPVLEEASLTLEKQ